MGHGTEVCVLAEGEKEEEKMEPERAEAWGGGAVVAVGKGTSGGDGVWQAGWGAVMGAAWRHASLPPLLGLVSLSCQMKSCN